jgi:fused signal recognition particle receptor
LVYHAYLFSLISLSRTLAMAFNWFRRQFTQPEDAPEPEVTQGDSASESEAPATEDETVQEDYLAWAKAAYQNIQQRQQTSPSVTEDVVLDSPDTSVSAKPLTVQAQTVEEVSADVTPETIVAAEGVTAEPKETEIVQALGSSTEDSLEGEDSAISAVVDDAVTIDTGTTDSSSALPLWARADAERQARLDRLKATAIEEASTASAIPQTAAPVPPAPQPAAPVSRQTGPETEKPETSETPNLDEGFLWSAEVLAAQGRRPEEISADEITWLQKLRQGLDKTRRGVVNQLKTIVGKGPLTQDAVMEIEALLLQADVGVEATDTIIDALQKKMLQETLPPDEAIAYLKKILRDILDAPLQSKYSAAFTPEKHTLNIWLMTGVNGAGKTTTIGKLAHVAKESGYVCLVAAADTFRAAAVEQVKVWAGRSGVDVIANPGQNTDPAAVVFDAIAAAQSRNIELLLVDTAGRLQNKKNLMDELRKVRQVIDKKAPNAKVESLLVLDATLGQNGLRQAQVFSEAAQLSGVVLTKLDGTAKGGVALAVVQQLGLPIRFIGAGEGIKDLRPFSSYEFVEALLSN